MGIDQEILTGAGFGDRSGNFDRSNPWGVWRVFNWKTKETNSLEGHRAEFRTVQSSSRVRQNGHGSANGVPASIWGIVNGLCA